MLEMCQVGDQALLMGKSIVSIDTYLMAARKSQPKPNIYTDFREQNLELIKPKLMKFEFKSVDLIAVK